MKDAGELYYAIETQNLTRSKRYWYWFLLSLYLLRAFLRAFFWYWPIYWAVYLWAVIKERWRKLNGR